MTGTIADVRSLAVLGLGRLGAGGGAARAARAARRARSSRSTKGEAELGDGAGRAARGRRRRSLLGAGGRAAGRRRAARQEPRRAQRLAGRGRGAGPRRDDLERGRVRGPVPERTAGSRSPAPTARRRRPSSPARSCATPACRSRWPATSAGRSPTCPAQIDPGRRRGRRALELPARTHRALPARRRRAAEPDRGPHRPPRQLRRLRRRQAAHLRKPDGRPTSRCVNADDPGTAAAVAGRPAGARPPGRLLAGRPRRRAARGAAPRPRRSLAGRRRDGTLLAADAAPAREELCRGRRARPEGRAQRGELAGRRRGRRGARRRGRATSPPPCARFAGVAHRLQVVGVVAGVTWVNDSKATNVDAALKALTAYSGPVHLILGGSLKGASFDPLAAATEGRVKEAILIGAAAAPLREAFERRARRGGREGDAVRRAARPRGGRRARRRGRRAGRRRAAQPRLRELRPVQELRAAGRTLRRAGQAPRGATPAMTARRPRSRRRAGSRPSGSTRPPSERRRAPSAGRRQRARRRAPRAGERRRAERRDAAPTRAAAQRAAAAPSGAAPTGARRAAAPAAPRRSRRAPPRRRSRRRANAASCCTTTMPAAALRPRHGLQRLDRQGLLLVRLELVL